MLTNPAKSEAVVKIGGKNRPIKFAMAQVCELEEILNDANVFEMITNNRFNQRARAAALYVGLRAYDKAVTLPKVQDWMQDLIDANDHEGLGRVVTDVIAALMCSMTGPQGHELIKGAVNKAGQVLDGKEGEQDKAEVAAPLAESPAV